MTERSSYWTRALVPALALAALMGAGAKGGAAQTEAAALCAPAAFSLECQLTASAVGLIQPRVGLGLWGGNPVPGTASTAGYRFQGAPRWSVGARTALVPTALPPILDRSETASSTATLAAASVHSTVALMHGFSPLPTVGGVFSLDLLGRVSAARLPVGKGFDRGAVVGLGAGLRLGLLRESFTLPGVSMTAVYGRSTEVTFGDPGGLDTDGHIQGAVSGLGLTAAASRRVLGLRLTGAVAWDRYASDVRLRYAGPAAGSGSTLSDTAVMERWSGFGSITWTRLIYHTVLEVGWQAAPSLPTLPAGVEVSPMTLWAALAFRITP
ncbi:MAG: hypothetical protein R6U63_04080 [Longimicrobiales bacterium]